MERKYPLDDILYGFIDACPFRLVDRGEQMLNNGRARELIS